MKTKLFFLTLCISLSVILNAQLKVFSNGVVETQNQTVIRSNATNITDNLDIIGDNPSVSGGVDLIWGRFYQTQPNNPGLLTLASADGANFTVRANGKVGIYNPNPSVALEIGTTSTNHQVKVNGVIVLGSDERIKENIQDITNSIEQIKKLRSVSYTFKQTAETEKTTYDTLKYGNFIKPKFKPIANTENQNRSHYGFLAQDVQKIFPDLVYKDSAGMLGVDYIGIIPLLLDALKDQQAQIDAHTKQISYLLNLVGESSSGLLKVGASPTTGIVETNALTYPVLDQNTPNPFNTETTIGFYLPTTINAASIYIYNMNGGQLKNIPINERRKGNVTIKGSEFIAGMYLYALIADGKVIDTKRMILTK